MPITSDNVACRFRGALTTAIEVMWRPQVGGLSEPNLCPQPTPEIVDSHRPRPLGPVICRTPRRRNGSAVARMIAGIISSGDITITSITHVLHCVSGSKGISPRCSQSHRARAGQLADFELEDSANVR